MENTKNNLIRIEHDIEAVLTHPLHLRIEYFFRKRFCLLAVMVLMSIAIIKSDGKMLGIMREAYAQGFGMIGAYLREETARTPITIEIARISSISGR